MIKFPLEHDYLSYHGVAANKLKELKDLNIVVESFRIKNYGNKHTLHVTMSDEDEFYFTLKET